MPVEALKSFFDWGTVALVGLTFVFGAGALITGSIISERQAERLRQFDRDLTAAKTELSAQQERAAKAEMELRKYVEYVRKEATHRTLSPEFAKELKGRPTGAVEILYNPGDTEAYMFALQIAGALKDANWIASPPKPIPSIDSKNDLPPQFRHGTSGPLALIAKRSADPGEKTASGAIWDAVRSALEVNWGFATYADPAMPDGHFIIVVGQK